MNFSFDWGAVAVCLIGAGGSLFVMKADMKWLKDGLNRLEGRINSQDQAITRAHDRIDGMLGGGPQARRHTDAA